MFVAMRVSGAVVVDCRVVQWWPRQECMRTVNLHALCDSGTKSDKLSQIVVTATPFLVCGSLKLKNQYREVTFSGEF